MVILRRVQLLDTQMILNTLFGIIAVLFGWLARIMWESIKDLQKSGSDTAEKVQRIEVLVAGNYVRKDDLDKKVDAIFTKLDKISDKLDGKVDKGR